MLDHEESKIDTITIELRYDPAFGIWDRAGEIWKRVQAQFPELRFQNAMPLQQIFESADARAMVELEAFRVICRGPDADKKTSEIAQALLNVCSDQLRIAIFTRIGLREVKKHSFASIEEAFSAVNSLLPAALVGKFLTDSTPLGFSFGLRQENKANGLLTSIRTEERERKLAFPWELRDLMSSDPPKEYLAIFDSDYYTIGATKRDALDIEEWARQGMRAIKKYWKSALA
jgi:hypothetical protein